uniref:Transmembrane protein 267 n=2 Tax=Macrostomum lignano TaxID=282301 RepID=A0A1I8HCI0_9PLAT
MQKNGAGLHTASSCYWDNQTDGSCTIKWENKTMHVIVTNKQQKESMKTDSAPAADEKQPPAAALSDRLSLGGGGGGGLRFIYPVLHTSLLALICTLQESINPNRLGLSVGSGIPKGSYYSLAAVLFDWLAHMTLAGQSWSLAANLTLGRCFVLESAVYACVLATVIDVDHFLAAGSLNPWRVINCSNCPRGVLHNSLLLLVIVGLFLAYERGHQRYRGKPPAVPGLAWLTLVAWGSHQLRDARRRGLLLWPLQSTQPLGFHAFLLSILGLAWSVRLLLAWLRYDVRSITIRPPPEELQLV